MRIYLSGPVTGILDRNRPAFERAADQLADAGFDVIVPHHLIPVQTSWGDAMRIALRAVLRADALATLDGWQQSRGARLEVQVAEAVGMPVRSVAEWADGRAGARSIILPRKES